MTNCTFPSVASITVATNAVTTLPRQLDALRCLTRPLQEIIVVDNASTDGTAEMLRERYPQVKHLQLPSNQGVGGGYAEGLRYAALQKKHDWVWLLDDDSVPAPDALEKLLEAWRDFRAAGDRVGILASTPAEPASGCRNLGWMWRVGLVRPDPDKVQRGIWYVDLAISSGSLISREVVERVGLPRVDFFMDFVDYEYCLRIRGHGYKIAMVGNSTLSHTIGNARTVRVLWHSRTRVDYPPWREYYISRNQTYTVWNHYVSWGEKFYVIRFLLRRALGIVAFGRDKRACLGMIMSGFLDGRAGKLGVRFLPGTKSSAELQLTQKSLEA